jgi:hypothetical protein
MRTMQSPDAQEAHSPIPYRRAPMSRTRWLSRTIMSATHMDLLGDDAASPDSDDLPRVVVDRD